MARSKRPRGGSADFAITQFTANAGSIGADHPERRAIVELKMPHRKNFFGCRRWLKTHENGL